MSNPYSSILRQLHEAQTQAAAAAAPARAQRQPKKKAAPVYSSSSSESESESSSSEYMSESDIDDAFEEEPCTYISPAGLSSKKTKKEKIDYLKEKKCPRVPDLKKKSKPSVSKRETVTVAPEQVKKVRVKKAKVAETPVVVSQPAAPAPETSPAKKVRAKKAAAAPEPVAAPAVAAVAAPAAGEKKKRAPSAYALCVGKHRKAGLSFADAAKAAKAECDAKKGK